MSEPKYDPFGEMHILPIYEPTNLESIVDKVETISTCPIIDDGCKKFFTMIIVILIAGYLLKVL